MSKTIAEQQLDSAVTLLGVAVRNVKECQVPDEVTRLLALAQHCGVVKEACIARASELEFRRLRAEGK
jgi:hypothetical protein